MDKQMIKENRNLQIDILKAILMVCVILGHISKIPYFDWFHMPLFFMISGYLLKVPNKGESTLWIGKRAKRLLIPYVVYYFIFLLLEYKEISLGNIKNLIFSGKRLTGIFGVWWFPVCLLLSSIILVTLINYMTKKQIKWILGISYFSAIIISNLIKISESNFLFFIPWNLDVCLLSVPYMAMGYYYKVHETIITKKLFRKNNFEFALLIMGGLIIGDVLGIYQYVFGMKYSQYTNVILPLVIPIAAYVLLYKVARLVIESRMRRMFEEFGKITMVLMYTHNFVIYRVSFLLREEHIVFEVFLVLIICLVIGYIWAKICNFNRILKMLFVDGKLGEK